MRRFFLFATLAGTLSFGAQCQGATYNCNGSQSDCQTRVNAASDGDTVVIPSGNFTWTSPVSWTNKNITVIGQGSTSTIINGSGAAAFIVTDTAKASFRITGIGIRGTGDSLIRISSSGTTNGVYGWRIDHMDFKKTGGPGIEVIGLNWGVVDHSTFAGNFNGVHVIGYTDSDFPVGPDGIGAASWSHPLNLGTNEAVYVEDCTFSGTGGGLAVNDMSYGARMVFRHNTVSNTYFQSHSARTNDRGGSLSFEVYNNSFTGAGFYRGFLILAGTGVIFDNTISGYMTNAVFFGDQRASQQFVNSRYLACDGTHAWDGNTEATGWPCLDQIGRGPGTLGSQPTVPVYMWSNGTTSTCASGGTCDNATGVLLNSNPVNLGPYIKTTTHSNGDKDYCVGPTMPTSCGNHMNNYAPYTYPHPLQSSKSSKSTAPPTRLTATVQ